MQLSRYELEQLRAIEAWKNEEPGVASMAIGLAASPVMWLVKELIPENAIRAVLEGCNELAHSLTDRNDILIDAGVSRISELKRKELSLCDDLADNVHNWAIGIAMAEGGVAGALGLFGIAVDIPATIILALRTIHKIGLCYGFEPKNEMDKKFAFGILAAAGANSMEEKVKAILLLEGIKTIVAKQAWKVIAEKAMRNPLGKEGAIIAVKNLAKQLGINLTKRKILQAIPVIGGVIGASVNGWFIKDVGWAARRAFQEKWLLENRKIGEKSLTSDGFDNIEIK